MPESCPDCVIVVQARMNSARLPGKSLAILGGKPSLQHLLEGLRRLDARAALVVATSNSPADDPIGKFCASQGVQCHRGDELNVASRFIGVAAELKARYLVRISGDSPLFDYRIAAEAIALARTGGADLVSTTLGDRYPSGMHVEVLRAKVFAEHYPLFSKPEHFEHVTPYFYEHPELFTSQALPCPLKSPAEYRFALDTAEDYARLLKIFEVMDRPHFDYAFLEKCSIFRTLFSKGAEERQ